MLTVLHRAHLAPSPMSIVRATHADSRLPLMLGRAVRLFRTCGFEGTSVRDIARAVGMLPGSLYCHFATKEDLLAAIYVKGVQQISASVATAIDGKTDPWGRLEAACVAHLEAILRDDDYAQVVVRVRPADAPAAQARLVALRDEYEALLAGLVKALPLRRGSDRRALRMMLLGALNWSRTWYRDGGTHTTPRAIARQFVSLLRQSQERGDVGARGAGPHAQRADRHGANDARHRRASAPRRHNPAQAAA